MKIRDGVLLNPRSVTAAAREPAGWLVWRGPWRRSVNPRGPRVCGAGLPSEFAAQPALFASLASTNEDTKMDCSAHPEKYLHSHYIRRMDISFFNVFPSTNEDSCNLE